MAVVAKCYLLEAGSHFGCQTKRWNPKMKEYIFSSRDDIYIIDLEKTVECIEDAYAELLKACLNGGKVLFVGTKKQAQEVCKEEAARSGSYYVTERWLGGTLTNFKTIRDRVKRLIEIENMEKSGKFEVLPKKEVSKIQKEYAKLNALLSGIREMTSLPKAVIVVDPKIEFNAVREAKRLHIPVFGIVDTDRDPDTVDYVIPANDDAVRSIKVILGVLNNAVCESNNLETEDYVSEEEYARTKKAKLNNKVEVIEKQLEEKVEDIKEVAKEVVKETLEAVKDATEEVTEVVEKAKKVAKEVKKAVKEVTEKTEDLTEMTLAELKKIAKEKEVKGYSTMKKDELLKALK